MNFFSSRTSGDINARYNDGDSLRDIVTGFSLDFITNIGYAIWALFLLLSINWQICVIAVAMEELMILVQIIYRKKTLQQNREMMQRSTELDAFVVSSFSASETVKNYNSEKLMEQGMQERFKKYQDIKYKNEITYEIEGNIISIINQLGNICMLGTLGIFVMNGNITTGELVKAYMYVSYLFGPIQYLMNIKGRINQITAVLERLDDVFKTTTEEELDKRKQHIQSKIETIKFENVSFHYGMKNDILKEITFDIKQGDSIGIIGISGCGKTTLIKLIMAFYQVTGGAIKINEKDINTLSTSSIRRRISYVSQNDFWFQDTIYNNLRIGNQNATTEFIDKICEMVKMKDFIGKLPYRYNTVVEEGATNFSAGERQRLSIAKALISNPDVLILDESTSNLDAETEEFVVERLKQEKDKIKIIIAHRLNTLRHCNKIISIENGKIVEIGTPHELIEKKGMFYRFWTSQSNAFGEKTEIKSN